MKKLYILFVIILAPFLVIAKSPYGSFEDTFLPALYPKEVGKIIEWTYIGIDYNTRTKQPSWVSMSYSDTIQFKKHASNPQNLQIKKDDLHPEVVRITPEDYDDPRFVMAQLMPPDFYTTDGHVNEELYLMSNISPMYKDFYEKCWQPFMAGILDSMTLRQKIEMRVAVGPIFPFKTWEYPNVKKYLRSDKQMERELKERYEQYQVEDYMGRKMIPVPKAYFVLFYDMTRRGSLNDVYILTNAENATDCQIEKTRYFELETYIGYNFFPAARLLAKMDGMLPLYMDY